MRSARGNRRCVNAGMAACLPMVFIVADASAFVREFESQGTSRNNTAATAQTVTGFARNTDPNVVGTKPTVTVRGNASNTDVDFYRVLATGSGSAWFDIDQVFSPTFGNHAISLFDASGNLLGHGRDGGLDAGSPSAFNPFLGEVHIPASGFYYVAVSERTVSGGVTAENIPANVTAFGTRFTPPAGWDGGATRLNNTFVRSAEGFDFRFNGPQPSDSFNWYWYDLHISGPFANAVGFINAPAGQWGSALGGAGFPGGVDLKIQGTSPFSASQFSAARVTDPNTLPTPNGFQFAGDTLQAWNLQDFAPSEHASVEVVFGYDEAPLLSAGLTEQDARLYQWVGGASEPGEPAWMEVGTVNAGTNEVFVTTNQFSPGQGATYFVLGVVPEPAAAGFIGLTGVALVRRGKR